MVGGAGKRIQIHVHNSFQIGFTDSLFSHLVRIYNYLLQNYVNYIYRVLRLEFTTNHDSRKTPVCVFFQHIRCNLEFQKLDQSSGFPDFSQW